jgi:hypothetical protein
LSEAIRNGSKLSLDSTGQILVQLPNGGFQLLTEQSHNREVSDGKRRGYNGKQPRTSDGIKHTCYVTTADGRTYDFNHKTRTNATARLDRSSIIGKLDPSNDYNPDA